MADQGEQRGVVARIDAMARAVDDYIGGVESIALFQRRSLLAFLLPFPVYFFAVYGPAALSAGGGPLWRGWPPVFLLVAALILQFVYFVFVKKQWMRRLHLLLVAGCSSAAWWLASDTARENSGNLYHHGYGVAATLSLVSVAVLVPGLAALPVFTMPTSVQAAFKSAFDAKLVLAEPAFVPATARDFVRAAITEVTSRPLHILVPTAVLTLFAPARLLLGYTVGALLTVFVISAMANLHPARDAIVRFIGRTLLSGSASIVSLVVLGLVVCRLLSIDYVTTVLDASSVWTVLSYLAAAYSLIWLHDFWVHQSAIDSLSSRDQRQAMKESKPGAAGALDALAPAGIVIVRHGEGRVRVSASTPGLKPRVFEPGALLRRVSRTSSKHQRDSLELLAEQSQARLTGFAACSNVLFALSLWVGWQAAQQSTVEKHQLDAGHGQFDLGAHLVAHGESSPAILVAASGGGTRAALYAAAVLHGIQRAGHASGITLISSVSGGGAASAYFASDLSALSRGDSEAWTQMRTALAKPFIQDVLAGIAEWRILGPSYMGQLLAESFDKHFWGRAGAPRMRTKMSEVRELGLIYNAALCAIEEGGASSPRESGGFALLTNMTSTFELARTNWGWPETLPLRRVVQPELRLTRAAAISANFPPVFSNIPLDVGNERFWLTDGGAAENRALIPLLVALSEALAAIPQDVPIRPIRIVVAEASAFDITYHTDRGLGAKFGAAAQIANGFIAALNERIANQLAERTPASTDFHIVNLPMPAALRAAGTFGTHWMMPPRVPLGAPAESKLEEHLELDSADVVGLVDALLSKDPVAYVQSSAQLSPYSEQLIDRLALRVTPSLWQTLTEGLASPPP